MTADVRLRQRNFSLSTGIHTRGATSPTIAVVVAVIEVMQTPREHQHHDPLPGDV